VTVINFV